MRTQAGKRRQHDAALHATYPKSKYSPLSHMAPLRVRSYCSAVVSAVSLTLRVNMKRPASFVLTSRWEEEGARADSSAPAVQRPSKQARAVRAKRAAGQSAATHIVAGAGRCDTYPSRIHQSLDTYSVRLRYRMTTRHGVVTARRAAASPHEQGGRRSTRGAARRRDSHGGLGGEFRRDCRPGAHGLCR